MKKNDVKLKFGVLFLYDNAPAYRSEVGLKAIHRAGFDILDHPPYSSLSPPRLAFILKFKGHIRGTKFEVDKALWLLQTSF